MYNIEDKVKNIICGITEIEKSNIKDSDLIYELGIDSLDIISLVLDVEEEFNIEISDEDLWEVRTFGELISIIKKLIDRK